LITLADLFTAGYRTGGEGVDFSSVRLHRTGAERACRVLRARAFTVGSDVYFAAGAFAPHTPAGLRLLAHEVAHVVQQRRGAVAAVEVLPGLAVAPAGAAEEREADAAADALLAGRPFAFAMAGSPPSSGAAGPGRVAQRYMAWEHCVLGDMDPALVREAAQTGDGRGSGHLEAQCALLECLGRDPRGVDEEQVRVEYPGIETLRLPGSGLVVTLGELNVLPDYLGHPRDIETAPAAFLEPLVQSFRSWSIAELRRSAGHRGPRRLLPGALGYPRLGALAEIGEAMAVDGLGRRCGFEPWNLYSSVVGRNAAHFAPFSWYRWQSFHLMARELIERSLTATQDDRERLRTRARIYAGYADHFLHDSFAAGHLINKTLVMQWYIEWLAQSRVSYLDHRLLARMTADRQPTLHGPGLYDRGPTGLGAAATIVTSPPAQDPQTVVEASTMAERITASGVAGRTETERRAAYGAYLAMLGSSVAQLAAGVVHGYLNKRSLVVAAGQDGPRFRLQGDYTLLATLGHQAWASHADGRPGAAVSLAQQAITLHRQHDDRRSLAIMDRTAALANSKLGEHRLALAHLAECEEILAGLDLPLDVAMTLNCLGEVHYATGSFGKAEAFHALAAERSAACEAAGEEARAVKGLAVTARATGSDARADGLYRQAATLYAKFDQKTAASIRQRLGPKALSLNPPPPSGPLASMRGRFPNTIAP
jgi:Domain of unknown function (DUF4157)